MNGLCYNHSILAKKKFAEMCLNYLDTVLHCFYMQKVSEDVHKAYTTTYFKV